jgi:purine-nucleoside phosphorylase
MDPVELARQVRDRVPGAAPKVGVVLGSGLGDFAAGVEGARAIPYRDLPGFPRSGVSGHVGELVLGRIGGLEVAVLSGRAHYYEHGDPREMAVAIATLAALGVETLILTNAAGSLRPEVGPGSLMLVCDHIALGPNPLVGMRGDDRFVSMVYAYDPALRQLAHAAAAAAGIALAEGVYMWFSGPSFETPAEIRMARVLGADAVGMSTAPEVILARHAGLRVLAVSLVTNLAAGMTGRALSHAETKAEAARGGAALGRLLVAVLDRLAKETP